MATSVWWASAFLVARLLFWQIKYDDDDPSLTGFWPPPQFFVTCNAYYEDVFCGLPNNKMTSNDIHANQTTSFVRIHVRIHDRSGLLHNIVLVPDIIDNSVLSRIISLLSFKGIHNGICNLRYFSMCTSLLQGWMSMTLHSPVRCSVTRWITRMGSTSCRRTHFGCMVQGSFLAECYVRLMARQWCLSSVCRMWRSCTPEIIL